MAPLFYIFAAVAIVAGLSVVIQRTPVYSALSLIVVLCSLAVVYLLLGAEFMAVVQVIVYAGAIMVLFLFVIMLLGAEELAPGKALPWQKPLAGVLAAVLVIETAYLLLVRGVPSGLVTRPAAYANSMDSLREMAVSLFGQYLLPFEVTSILLLVAMVGAIILTKKEKGVKQ